jgi:Protein of unknown function (DUF3277)
MAQGKTYSFKSLTGVLTNPVFAVVIPLTGGNIGVGSITIRMTTTRTTHDVAADGTVMPSYIAGDNGEVDLVVQETSAIHQALLALYNLCVLAANNDDVSGWAATAISFTFLIDGSVHTLTGVSFEKVPDKPYEANGQKMTWKLMAANIYNL